jgi:PleD family two-component response regulator
VASEPGKAPPSSAFSHIARREDTCSTLLPSLGEWRGAGTILLVDDDDTIRLIAKRILERLGFDVFLPRTAKA